MSFALRDHRLNNFPGYEHEVWAHKREHAARARARVVENSGDMKIIAVYVGWFMEEAIRVRNFLLTLLTITVYLIVYVLWDSRYVCPL